MASHQTVWDRLYDPVTYTGVYGERFRDGPGINQDTDARAWKQRTSFQGYTNTATDEVIRDISDITRPYLNSFPRERVVSPRERRVSQVRERAKRGETDEVAYPLDANTQLQLIFQYYCKFGRTGARGDSESTIDSFNFMRFARECPGMLDSRLDRAEVDLIFTKCRVKGRRRLEYREFLDALSAMAITKFPAEDPVTAFSLILSHHVFNCAPAVGLREARAMQERSRAIREEAAAAAAAEADEAEEVAASARSALSDSAAGGPATAYWAQQSAAHAAEARARSDAMNRYATASPADRPGQAHAPAPAPALADPPRDLRTEAAYGAPGGASAYSSAPPGSEGTDRRETRLAPGVGPAPELAAPPPSARAAAAAAAATESGAVSAVATPPRPEFAPAGAPSFMSPTTASAIDQMRRVEDLAAERAAARSRGVTEGSATGWDDGRGSSARVPPPSLPHHHAYGSRPATGVSGPHYAPRTAALPRPSSAVAAAASAGRARRQDAGWASTSARTNPDDPAERLPRDERFRGRLQRDQPGYAIGSPQFRPTLAGQANKPGSVYDRLSNPTNFTGVYRRAYFTDGRMNAYADTGVSSIPSRFVGDTNTGTNETIHSISVTLRPGLRNGGGFR